MSPAIAGGRSLHCGFPGFPHLSADLIIAGHCCLSAGNPLTCLEIRNRSNRSAGLYPCLCLTLAACASAIPPDAITAEDDLSRRCKASPCATDTLDDHGYPPDSIDKTRRTTRSGRAVGILRIAHWSRVLRTRGCHPVYCTMRTI